MTEATPSSPAAPHTVAVTGASGLVGAELVRQLTSEGRRVLRMVRQRGRAGGDDVFWDPARGEIDAEGLRQADAVVHLAGENVGQRWTEERKRRILSSRVDGTALLARTMASMADGPRTLVQASAIGIYGPDADDEVDEAAPHGGGFLADVVRQWEAASAPAETAGVRVVRLRIGVVLSAAGGALAKLLPPFRLGAGGRVADGRMWMSWVSLADVVGAFRYALDHPEMAGPYNVVAPNPVRNEEFTRVLGEVLNRPTLFPVPAFALRALFGDMADETVLASQRVAPRRLTEAGFHFRHPDLPGALRSALRENGGR